MYAINVKNGQVTKCVDDYIIVNGFVGDELFGFKNGVVYEIESIPAKKVNKKGDFYFETNYIAFDYSAKYRLRKIDLFGFFDGDIDVSVENLDGLVFSQTISATTSNHIYFYVPRSMVYTAIKIKMSAKKAVVFLSSVFIAVNILTRS